MHRWIGFILFWVSLGMLIQLVISNVFIGIVLIIIFMLIGFNLYFCKQGTGRMDTNELGKKVDIQKEPVSGKEPDIDTMNLEELQKLKRFLFEERIRIMQEQEKQKEVYNKFIKERLTFQEEMKTLNRKVLTERKRLKDESAFFDKKLKILQNGFLQLDLDRKKLEREKRQFEEQKRSTSYSSAASGYYKGPAPDFFKGVNNILGLKKRYRDLLKIFHPDNLCGDSDTVLEINRQYEAMRKRMGDRF